MAIEKPEKRRARVDEKGIFLQINIPPNKNIFLILFLCGWFGFWSIPETDMIKELIQGTQHKGFELFPFFWLMGWTVGGVMVLLVIIWIVAGSEVITFSPFTIKIERKAYGVGLSKEYSLSEVRNLRTQMSGGSIYSGLEAWGFGGGRLAFDYELKTVKFASGIDEEEAVYLLDVIKQKGIKW
jgi:hypothetical protein